MGAEYGITLAKKTSRQTCQALPQCPHFNWISQWSACSVHRHGGNLPRARSSSRQRRTQQRSLAWAIGCSQATGAAILHAKSGVGNEVAIAALP